MDLDLQTCTRARLTRDARFDGKFFIAVLTTRVYCRSICPARTAREDNVRYYPSAAAAAEAGFRPCLRCRPECSPGTPAWIGTPSTVSRALRLIGELGLDDRGVEGLAEQLGVTSRHLRRLFVQHLGASPITVAQTRRIHFSKLLLNETSLPMSEVAAASGFGSVRRFNAAMQRVYHRTPTQLRKLGIQPRIEPNMYRFRLRFRPPYDWKSMLAFLALRATPGVESVDENSYRRSISFEGSDGYFDISMESDSNTLLAQVHFGDPRGLFRIIERIRAMFDLNADCAAITSSLRSDPALASSVKAHPGLRVPGCWDGFELTVRAIIGQQISVKGATTLAGRIAQTYGRSLQSSAGLTHLFPTAQVLANADFANIGLTGSRVTTIRNLARAVCDGSIDFDRAGNTTALLDRLCSIPGIGRWTAEYVAMRALREPDAFPSSDLVLLRAMDLRSAAELERCAEAWRPWRAYAALYLWKKAGAAVVRPAQTAQPRPRMLSEAGAAS